MEILVNVVLQFIFGWKTNHNSQMIKVEGNTFLLNSVASSYIWYIDEILIQWNVNKKNSTYFSETCSYIISYIHWGSKNVIL